MRLGLVLVAAALLAATVGATEAPLRDSERDESGYTTLQVPEGWPIEGGGHRRLQDGEGADVRVAQAAVRPDGSPCCPPPPPQRVVSASASGTVRRLPDVGTINAAVVTIAATADMASRQNERESARALEAVRAVNSSGLLGAGAELLVRVEQLIVQPNMVWISEEPGAAPTPQPVPGPGRGRFEQRGFRAERTIVVEQRGGNLETGIPALVAALVDRPGAANRINSLSYSLSEELAAEARNAALAIASRLARQQAATIARGSGARLGAVLNTNANSFQPIPRVSAFSRAEFAPSPGGGDVSPGVPEAFSFSPIPVTASVSSSFELVPLAPLPPA